MIKTIATREKEKIPVPKRVQDMIPVNIIYDDGVFKCGERRFSRSWSFSDINYAVIGEEAETNALIKYAELLNSFDSRCTVKITVSRHKRNRAEFERTALLPMAEDGMDGCRKEVNAVLEKDAAGKSSVVTERYITVSYNCRSVDEAREYFDRVEAGLKARFRALGSDMTTLDADGRLRVIHGFYRPEERQDYAFDLHDARRKGHSFKDYICPDSAEFKPSYFRLGNRYGRALFLRNYASELSDKIISDLTAVSGDIMMSIDFLVVPTDEAVQDTQTRLLGIDTNITKWQERQNRNNNFSAIVPYPMEQQRKAIEDFLKDITDRDQKMMQAVITLVHTADSLEHLDADTELLMQAARSQMCQLGVLRFQQLEGLTTALPFGVRRLDIFRTLTTESLAIFVPFRAAEIYQPSGVYYGRNAVTESLIKIDRSRLKNGNGFILGVPGGGKSMLAKWEILCKRLIGQADIIIIDPEREYGKLVRALGGEVINVSAGADTHINPFDMTGDYNDGKNPIVLKAELIMSLCQMVRGGDLGAREKSIIGRCTENICEDYISSGYVSAVPTLRELREELLRQPEDEAQKLALELELFTSGTLDVFAHKSNVDVDSSLVCYDILDLGEQLQPVGMLIVLDSIFNRIIRNRAKGRQTVIVIDEIYLLFQYSYAAEFLFKMWKRVRKYGAYCTGITQNVDDLLQSHTARTMLSNSEFVAMLSQSASDREVLGDMFNISDDEMRYITDAGAGHGLIKVGSALIPFALELPQGTEIYRLMSTKPGEGGDTDG